MTALDDGTYDVIVVDAHDAGDDVVVLELALTRGDDKGDVVRLTARGTGRDAVSMLGLPATLHVERGHPRLVF